MPSEHYPWIALSNTTLGMLLATVNSSIVIISLPAIFRGIHLDPLEPGNVSYLLWMLMGYMLVSAVLVVTLGRLGDMFGRVRMYNAGFAVFTVGTLVLALDPLHGGAGALWLIGWRVLQGIGGAMLMANSAAILTDAFPAHRRGMAMGVNQVAGIAGTFIGLVAGGLLSEINWRLVFFASAPIGIVGTIWAYRSLVETAKPAVGARIDWLGNVTFAAGLTALLAAITYGIQPYGGHDMGWTNPWVLGGVIGGVAVLALFCWIETRVEQPMFHLSLFRIRAFAAGNLAGLLAAISRGGMQFMLIIWLQGIWLPLHGYDYEDTPLWAGIYLLPLTAGFLVAGPISGHLSDRHGARAFASGGLVLSALAFAGLLVIPTDFGYAAFALLIFLNGIGSGLFAAPNTTAIMNSVPADQRGVASGMRATFMNAGMVLSIGVFFSLMIAGLADTLPRTLTQGLTEHGVPAGPAARVGELPPVGTLFAAFLGYNPIQNLLAQFNVLGGLAPDDAATLTGRSYFPHLISEPFHHGLVIVFGLAIAMSLVAALVSLLRGRRYVHDDDVAAEPAPQKAGRGAA
ncbi:MFS transporter [Actinomadura mexicana]|uniref:Predicted arabinose efflux permease, MFS family n=1 Tax=Actinomadura mexicana TaxID=134959 RepID=A0A238XLZ9_9ACTN|nr:MFS transporter [Actinomadura mexicana]SNR58989.1 Predicted arabinose efflux permease, MFS family [Actinomadura mexicana]